MGLLEYADLSGMIEIRPQMAEAGKARQFAVLKDGKPVVTVQSKAPMSVDDLCALFERPKKGKS